MSKRDDIAQVVLGPKLMAALKAHVESERAAHTGSLAERPTLSSVGKKAIAEYLGETEAK